MGKLGLPLEYNKLHKYYDLLSQGNDASKNRIIEKILKKHNVETVLDLTCGTGAQALWLSKKGYNVTGADISPALLEIAKEKAKTEKIALKFIEGDMRTIKVGQFDAVITIFNAIGHLTKSGFQKAIRNIKSNLKDGGLYIFDILNLDAMTNQAVSHLTMDLKKTVHNTKIRNIQYSELDRDAGRLTSYDEFSIQEGISKPKLLKGKFTLQIYTAKELEDMLAKNGFETLGQYGIDGSKFSKTQTTSILTIARKS